MMGFFANTRANSNTTEPQERDLNLAFLVPHQENGKP